MFQALNIKYSLEWFLLGVLNKLGRFIWYKSILIKVESSGRTSIDETSLFISIVCLFLILDTLLWACNMRKVIYTANFIAGAIKKTVRETFERLNKK